MSIRYKNLLMPLDLGSVLLKNRMTAAAATPHFIQGTEPYPTEKWITMLANRAKNGASAVNINHLETGSTQESTLDFPPDHFSIMDFRKTSTHNYLCQAIDAIRYYGSIAQYPLGRNMLDEGAGQMTPGIISAQAGAAGGPGGPGGAPGGPGGAPGGPGGAPGGPSGAPGGPGGAPGGPGGAPGGPGGAPGGPGGMRENYDDPKARQEAIDDLVKSAIYYKKLGFQMLTTRMSQRGHIQFCVELADALKQSLGKDYPLEFYISGVEADLSVAHNLELARAIEGKVDILAVRYGVQDWQHPTGFTSSRQNPSPCVDLASALTYDVRARGGNLKIGISAGLHDPDFCENLIATDKADLIIMARTWFCDSEYGQKLIEGRGEDVTPCVRCNKCHVPNGTDMFRSFCTVNPKLGMEDKIGRMIEPVTSKKKVAVVGGGPGGMYAAITAADRGHSVTLYEKEPVLGGQLSHADYPSFKWPLADFKNYLINQMYKKGVDVKLNSFATKEMLEKENYDNVIVAVGATFTKANIPGADRENVVLATDVYGIEATLPKTIAVIGGSETGVETAMYLAENGHEATVMCRQPTIASDAAHAHYRDMVKEAWEKLPSFHQITSIQKYVSIDDTGVTYIDAEGKEQKLEAELVVMATGVASNTEQAAALYGAAPQTDYIGDCRQIGNVHFAVTTGYGAANQI